MAAVSPKAGESSVLAGDQAERPSGFMTGISACFLVVWIASAIASVDLGNWALENVPVLAAVIWLAATRRTLPLSNASYLFIALFLVMHEIGAHYTYEQVPVGIWMKPVFGFARNDYDRVVHFGFGLLLVLPAMETLRPFVAGPRWFRLLAPLMLLAALSCLYEIVEEIANVTLAPYTAAAYVGMQGDPFDSQNDMACAVAGSILALTAVVAAERRR